MLKWLGLRPLHRYWVETLNVNGDFGGTSVEAHSEDDALRVAESYLSGTRERVSPYRKVVLEQRDVDRLPAKLLGTVTALALLVGPAAVQAEVPCAPFQATVDGLNRDYGEALAWAGVGHDGALVVTYANGDTGTWTTIVRYPSDPDTACALASGTRFVFGVEADLHASEGRGS